jgi:hypothetical protein
MSVEALKKLYEKDKMSGNLQKFYFVNLQVLEREGIEKFSPTDNKGNNDTKDNNLSCNKVRLINPKGEELFGQEVFVHTKVGVNGCTYVCLKKMYNMPCPICEELESVRNSNLDDETKKSQMSVLYPRTKYFMYVLDLCNDKEIEKGIKWWDAPLTAFNAFRFACRDKETGEITDLGNKDHGRSILFDCTKDKGQYWKYSDFQVSKHELPLDDNNITLPLYKDVIYIPSYDEVKSAMLGNYQENTDITEEHEQHVPQINDVKNETKVEETKTTKDVVQETKIEHPEDKYKSQAERIKEILKRRETNGQ